MLHEQVFDAEGVLINYADDFAPRTPLVLLHGIASEWRSFRPLISSLDKSARVLAVDLRGHGWSGWVSDQYRVSNYAGDICKLLDSLEQPAALYGHSLGALIAIEVAASRPGQVCGLVLGDPPLHVHDTPTLDTPERAAFEELESVLLNTRGAEEIEAYLAEHYPEMSAEKRSDRAACLSHVDPGAVSAVLSNQYVQGYDLDALLRSIECPVLLVHGKPELGSVTRPGDIEYARERVKRLSILRMEEAGHALPPPMQLPAVRAFLESLHCGQGE